MWDVTAEPKRFDESADWLLKRTIVDAETRHSIPADARSRAFWIAGAAQLDLVDSVLHGINEASQAGWGFSEFKKDFKAKLLQEWGGKEPPHRLRLIYSNATTSSLNAGRWHQMRDPKLVKLRPYWMYDAVRPTPDPTPVCTELDGKIFPADDPGFNYRWPPLHHGCQTGVRSIRASEAKRRGGVYGKPVEHSPSEGFGHSPAVAKEWRPGGVGDKRDPTLLAQLDAKRDIIMDEPDPLEHVLGKHDPEYWFEQEYRDQYGEAGRSVAWGRAMEERGLERELGTLRGEIDALPISFHQRGLMQGLLNTVGMRRSDKTIRAVVDRLEKAGQHEAARRLRGISAMIEQRSSVSGAELLVGKTRKIPPHLTERAGQAFAETGRFYAQMSQRGVADLRRYELKFEDTRASCGRPHGTGLGRVTISSGRDGVHEVGHAIEQTHPELYSRAREFLERRTRGESEVSLRNLTRNTRYARDEVARPDGFFNPYVGKSYVQETEITSMGVEAVHSAPQRLAAADIDHFRFALGQLAGHGL